MGRPGTPVEVANACLFLASPAASYITEQLLMVDDDDVGAERARRRGALAGEPHMPRRCRLLSEAHLFNSIGRVGTGSLPVGQSGSCRSGYRQTGSKPARTFRHVAIDQAWAVKS